MKIKQTVPIFLIILSTSFAGIAFGEYIQAHDFKWQSPVQVPLHITAHKNTELVTIVKAAEYVIPDTESDWTRLLLEKKGKAAGLKESDIALLVRIGTCESGLRNVPNKSGVSSAIGAFQILAMHNNKGDRFTTQGNEDIAIKLYKSQGTTPWASSKFCWNLK